MSKNKKEYKGIISKLPTENTNLNLTTKKLNNILDIVIYDKQKTK